MQLVLLLPGDVFAHLSAICRLLRASTFAGVGFEGSRMPQSVSRVLHMIAFIWQTRSTSSSLIV